MSARERKTHHSCDWIGWMTKQSDKKETNYSVSSDSETSRRGNDAPARRENTAE